MNWLLIVVLCVGSLVAYALVAGLARVLFELILPESSRFDFCTDDDDHIWMGWAWPFTILVVTIYYTAVVLYLGFLKYPFNFMAWCGERWASIPIYLSKLPRKAAKNWKGRNSGLPKAKVVQR